MHNETPPADPNPGSDAPNPEQPEDGGPTPDEAADDAAE